MGCNYSKTGVQQIAETEEGSREVWDKLKNRSIEGKKILEG